MKVKLVGFFRELDHGLDNQISLKNNISQSPLPNKDKIIKYLSKGHLWIASTGLANDILSDNKIKICAPNILTDGVWAWPQDLVYYFTQYNVTLPIEFLKQMENNFWEIPSCDIDKLEF